MNDWFFYFWLKNIKVSILLFILILITWITSVFLIPKESSPKINIWIINIAVSYPWVNPVDMDSLVTEKIEDDVKDIDWIKKITSTSSLWSSLVSLELETWADTSKVLTDVKDKVDNISFPEDASDPVVVEVSTNDTLLFKTLIFWDPEKFDNFALTNIWKKIKAKLESVKWISSIDENSKASVWKFWWSSSWDNDYNIKVLISKSKAELLGLSLRNISSIIKANNWDTPIWNFSVWDLNYDFRFEWDLTSLEDLKNVVIRDSWTSKILLKDIAEFQLEYPWDKIMSLGLWDNSWKYYNYISLAFNKDEKSSVFEASNNAKIALKKLFEEPEFEWLKYSYSNDMSENIKKDYLSLWKNAISTIVLVFLTILFFVGFREWIVAWILLPLAFLITFIVLNSLWYTMNFLTNFSLILTLWIAIDTIIVIVEWASEKLKLGYSKKSAIILAIRDFKAPLISWTLTTLVAFIPLMSLPWVMWKFLSFIPITVFITLSAALFLSLTLSSAIFVILMKDSKYFIKEEKVERNLEKSDLDLLLEERKWKTEKSWETHNFRDKFLEKLWNFYSNLMHKIFSSTFSKIWFIIIPFILLILTFIFLSPKIWFTIFPASDQWIIQLTIKGQEWIKEENMKKYLKPLNDVLNKIPEIKTFSSQISWNKISTFIDLTDKEIRKSLWQRNSMKLENVISDNLAFLKWKWLEVIVEAAKWWPPTGSAVWIKLTVDDANKFEQLKQISNDFEKYLNTVKWTKNVGSSSSDTPGQFVFQFDKEKLSNIGLLPRDLLWEIYFYTNWIKSGSIKQNNQDNEIILSYKEFEDNVDPEDIMNLVVNTKVWKIRIWDFATFEFKNAVSSISREDTDIVINVTSELQTGFLPNQIQPKLIKFAEGYNFPNWFSYLAGWETADNQDLIFSVIRALFIAIFLIFSILVFQFNSFRQPAIVLYSIILALLWVNIWLYVTWNPYSMPFAIWFISLTWIVVNDAIILIDKINKTIRNAEKKHNPNIDVLTNKKGIDWVNYIEKVIVASKSRLQPVIVTTLTTIFWILPLAFQDEFWAALWFTIIFWIFVWSLMTIFVIPILYSYLVLGKKIRGQKK